MLFNICRGPESNRYDRYQSQDFKSCASASSATPASSSERRDSNPRPPPWQGGVLPLNYVRILCRLHDLNTRPSDYKSDALPTELSRPISIMRVKGLEPPRRKAPDPKSGASANSAKPAKYDPYWARTSDPLIKSQLLYQLS